MATQITGIQIKDETVTTNDIKDGTVTLSDLNESAISSLQGQVGTQGPQGPQGDIGVQGPQGSQGNQGESISTSSHFGTSTDYSYFRPNGTLQSVGAATVFDDLLPTAVYSPSGAASPNITPINGSGNIKCQEFPANASVEEFNPSYQFTHAWKEQSTIIPHLHAFIPANTSGNTFAIKFKMVYTWDNVDPTGSHQYVPDTEHTIWATYTVNPNTVANSNAIISFGEISGTGKYLSSILSARITRGLVANGDTYSNSVWLRSADIHIEKDTQGSDLEFTKFS